MTSPREWRDLLQMLGPLAGFHREWPTGRYHLDMGDSRDAAVFRCLAEISSRQARARRIAKAPDWSQSGRGEAFRNASWVQKDAEGREQGAPYIVLEGDVGPSTGTMQFDFVKWPLHRPPGELPLVEDAAFQATIEQGLEAIAAAVLAPPPLHRVDLLDFLKFDGKVESLLEDNYLSTAQVRRVLELHAGGAKEVPSPEETDAHRASIVDILGFLLGRMVCERDWEGAFFAASDTSSLGGQTELWELAHERLGVWARLDPAWTAGDLGPSPWRLDVSRVDERKAGRHLVGLLKGGGLAKGATVSIEVDGEGQTLGELAKRAEAWGGDAAQGEVSIVLNFDR